MRSAVAAHVASALIPHPLLWLWCGLRSYSTKYERILCFECESSER